MPARNNLTAPARKTTKTLVDLCISADELARGKYLVRTSGCQDCRTRFKMSANGLEPAMNRPLSGHP